MGAVRGSLGRMQPVDWRRLGGRGLLGALIYLPSQGLNYESALRSRPDRLDRAWLRWILHPVRLMLILTASDLPRPHTRQSATDEITCAPFHANRLTSQQTPGSQSSRECSNATRTTGAA